MRESTCSAGVVTSDSTSLADAPGNGISTLAMVTLICGSSSRGVTSTANTPSSSAISAISGVICECRNSWLMRPEMPMGFRGSWVVGRGSWVVGRGSWVVGRGSNHEQRTTLLAAALQRRQCGDRVERDFFSRRDAGEHFHLVACRFTEAQLAKADLARLAHHIGAGHFAAPRHRGRRDEELLHPADGEISAREHARIQAYYSGRQVQPHLGRVRLRVGGGQDGYF